VLSPVQASEQLTQLLVVGARPNDDVKAFDKNGTIHADGFCFQSFKSR
jgi:hypothetical protein